MMDETVLKPDAQSCLSVGRVVLYDHILILVPSRASHRGKEDK